jgi:aspartate-semialdehyde dehydrogenase
MHLNLKSSVIPHVNKGHLQEVVHQKFSPVILKLSSFGPALTMVLTLALQPLEAIATVLELIL